MIVGEGYYAPPTLRKEDGTKRRRIYSYYVELYMDSGTVKIAAETAEVNIAAAFELFNC